MTKTEAFKAFNIKLLNTRWSWSGISDDKKHVAATIWTDECVWDKEKNIFLTKITEEWNYNWKSDKGNIETMNKLLKVLSNPYSDQKNIIEFQKPAAIGNEKYQTFCGT